MKSVKIFIAIVLVAGVTLFASGLIYMSDMDGSKKQNGLGSKSSKDKPFEINAAETEIGNSPFNILVLGGDWINDNTDTIILLNYNPANGHINMLSLPRDTQVMIKGKTRKLNFAYPFGGEKLAVSTVENLTGADIKNYVLLDLKSFRKLVDLFGGVYFDVPRNMKYSDPTQNLKINLKKGYQLLDGKKAEQLVRYRWGYEDGDLTRIKVQQDFIMAFINQKLTTKSLPKLKQALEILFDNIKTDISSSEALELMTQATKIDIQNINVLTLPGKKWPGKTVWYYKANKGEMQNIIKEYFSIN
ncbi:MAG: LCP family protein [Eubacteriales bacterium]|nr:LCP family protein [Eubacteriales bacterium]